VWSDATPTPIDTGQTTPVSAHCSYILLVVNALNQQLRLGYGAGDPKPQHPVSDAGPSQTVDCTSGSVTLGGSSSSAGPIVGVPVAGQQRRAWAPVRAANGQAMQGTYLLIVTNTISGCSDTSTVDVFQDLNAPVSRSGPDQTLTCGSPRLHSTDRFILPAPTILMSGGSMQAWPSSWAAIRPFPFQNQEPISF
ncbi:MAG: hypothetical protein IPH04_10710, partial [Saprospirales bacterium]|nr:hypothetical protein [Saprospirales bacterium]